MDSYEIALVSTSFDHSGIGTYSQNIYEKLQHIGVNVTKVQIRPEESKIQIGEGTNKTEITKLDIPFEPDLMFQFRCRSVLPDDFDLFHIAHPGISFLDIEPKVITCHDLIKYRSPRKYTEYVTRDFLYRPLRYADHVISISKTTADDLYDILNCHPSLVSTVYNGVASHYKPLSNVDNQIWNKYNLSSDERYLLYIGSEEPRKNVPRLLKAFSRVSQIYPDLHLLKIGSPSKFGSREKTLDLVSDLGIDDRVHFLENVPEAEMPHFYNLADVFAFPSLYEGFGLPALEALACGTPTVVADATSLPEIVGDAALLCDPEDTDSIVEAIERLLTDSQLRDRLQFAGPQRAAEFTWERTARETADVYESVLSARQ
ncbi:glycosyltransferase family 4 protein [Halosimplex halobium]|uniref:glycosyltransferase family 4 protein n=1 Tax=Halosimplex halobium TaxID=3396618 RepID=UPI003F569985